MDSTTSEPRQTKKQKKAIAFRANKGKSKKEESNQLDVPEQDNLDAVAPDKKRKRSVANNDDDDDDPALDRDDAHEGERQKNKKEKLSSTGAVDADAPIGEVVEGEGERKKKRQRGKKKSVQRGTKTEDGQPRFVLFVGKCRFALPRARWTSLPVQFVVRRTDNDDDPMLLR